MLKGSDLPVKSIAASVGYASRSHFSRAFQAKFGIDPSAFRSTPAGPRLMSSGPAGTNFSNGSRANVVASA
jgi:AraC-like DNA-binding protein